jgi:diaminopimelate decarboxylase
MEEEAVNAYQKAVDLGFKPVGIHTHIGSGILDPEPFKLAVHTLMDVAGRVYREVEVEFEFVDFGGGIGIPYEPHESILNLEMFSQEIIDLFKENYTNIIWEIPLCVWNPDVTL